ncbi:unnamed protein product [Prorocentrum cordatum]|uniref:Uncharacterized protein n=1 Tax=Prorocentrum cordatum TaxID=2364126 RepID=A0ABN9TS98_9DINO|nr:unnamed protein product [Polarella glacialis]
MLGALSNRKLGWFARLASRRANVGLIVISDWHMGHNIKVYRCASAGRGAPMHVARAVSLHWSRGSRPSAAAAGLREPAARLRALGCRLFCLPLDLGGQKLHIWCLLIFVVCSAALCIGLFEAERLTTHVLRSPCTVIGSELVDVGTCTVCDELSPSNCEEHPVATARLAVTFRPMHRDANVTGSVWYCKGRQDWSRPRQ